MYFSLFYLLQTINWISIRKKDRQKKVLALMIFLIQKKKVLFLIATGGGKIMV